MKHASTTALDDLEAAARAAHDVENAYRAEAAREIARLEGERIFAFRRIRLVRLLANAATGAATAAEDAATTGGVAGAQRRAVAAEFGWDAGGERHKEILDRLAPVGHAVAETGDVRASLASFETWYQGHAGEPFYRLFDVYVPEAPLVDF